MAELGGALFVALGALNVATAFLLEGCVIVELGAWTACRGQVRKHT
jgi:hypothetical protein